MDSEKSHGGEVCIEGRAREGGIDCSKGLHLLITGPWTTININIDQTLPLSLKQQDISGKYANIFVHAILSPIKTYSKISCTVKYLAATASEVKVMTTTVF